MDRRTLILPTILLSAALALTAGTALAGRGGNGGGGGSPGGGGEDPPANPEIAFIDLSGGGSALVVMNADGTSQTVVVASDAAEPAWSPDGNQLAFRDGGYDALYVVNVDGTGLRQLVSGGAESPVWSPVPTADGAYKIAFKRGGDIWLVDPDGTADPECLTNTPDIAENYPTWGPEATRIAVRCIKRDPSTKVWLSEGVRILHLDEGTETAICVTSHEDIVTLPYDEHVETFLDLDWARTRDKLAYWRLQTDRTVSEGNSDLYVLDLAAPGTPFQLTVTPAVSESRPSWSPDDSRILFRQNTGRKRDSGLYLVKENGSGTTSLDVKDGAWPDWRR